MYFRTLNDNNLPYKTHHSIFNECLFPLDQYQHSNKHVLTLTENKFDAEQLLSPTFALELEDVKKTITQLKLKKPKPTLGGPFSLNVDYYFKKVFEELDSFDSRLQNQKQERNLAIGTFTRSFGNSKIFNHFKQCHTV